MGDEQIDLDIAVNGEVVATAVVTGQEVEITILEPVRTTSKPWIEELLPFGDQPW